MEIAYVHLITNHIPIIGVPFALLVLAWGIWRKSDELKTAGFLLFALLGMATIGVYFLGQGGEDFIEDLPGVSHDSIEDHEGVALFALISVLLAAAASAFALLRYRFFSRSTDDGAQAASIYPVWVVILTVAIALASSATLGYTGRLGGKIRHPEFHGGVQASDKETNETDEKEDQDEGGSRRGRNRGDR